jgi:ATP-binding protein involved in chromosome partitioning
MSAHLPISESEIHAVLEIIMDPYLGVDLLRAKVLKEVKIADQTLIMRFRFGYPFEIYSESMLDALQKAFLPLLVGEFKLKLEFTWKINSHLAQKGIKPIPGIKNIIAVGSGKGGVGKSTTAVNLALAIQLEGARVGILDADIYGPSLPLVLGIQEKPAMGPDKRMQPVLKYGLQTISMGYLVDAEAPMVWRGPMVSTALQQLLNETAWDNLDYLIVDLPPGTGDIQLTMAQKIPVSGAVIVTTPQDIALLDAKKALNMFQKLEIGILGIVENMSTHICSACGHQEAIFGSDGGKKMSEQFDVPLLAQLPLDMGIRVQTDQGKPTVISDPNGKTAFLYREMAKRVTARLSLQARNYSVAFPTVVA